jgi:hypothetical protein
MAAVRRTSPQRALARPQSVSTRGLMKKCRKSRQMCPASTNIPKQIQATRYWFGSPRVFDPEEAIFASKVSKKAGKARFWRSRLER